MGYQRGLKFKGSRELESSTHGKYWRVEANFHSFIIDTPRSAPNAIVISSRSLNNWLLSIPFAVIIRLSCREYRLAMI